MIFSPLRIVLHTVSHAQMATVLLALPSYSKVVSLLCVFVMVINEMNFLFLKRTSVMFIHNFVCMHQYSVHALDHDRF